MTKEQRAEKAKLHKDLVDLLTDTLTDETYYTRLIWANQIIANILSNWEILEERRESNEKN